MLNIRASNERGHADHGWLNSFHTFSFASYHDPEHMGFRSLRVINEDWVAPGQGFGMHPHQNMEIITYVVKGAIAHKDSLGNEEILRPGEIQRMTAGSGIVHSEMNPSDTEQLHLLQIWILPNRRNLIPSYEQKVIPAGLPGQLVLIGSPDGRDGSVSINQDVRLFQGLLSAGGNIIHPLEMGRATWLQLVKGAVSVNGNKLTAGDAIAAEDESSVDITAHEESEFLIFDLGE